MSAEAIAVRPSSFSRRGRLVLALLFAAFLSWVVLDLSLADAIPKEGGRGVLTMFIEGALSPAMTYEVEPVAGTPPLLSKVLGAVSNTLMPMSLIIWMMSST